MKKKLLSVLIGGSFFLASSAFANLTPSEAVYQAINSSPQAQSAWHNYLSTKTSINKAQASNLPQADLTSSYSINSRSGSGWGGSDSSFSGASADLVISQNIFDSNLSASQVNKAKADTSVAFFESMGTINTVALDTITAYEDVLRYRNLVKIAEDNLAEHQAVFDKIEEGVRGGVSRRVDLEQINGRLSLAKANLITEQSNLHDVTARYIRVVGSLPPQDMLATDLSNHLDISDAEFVLKKAYSDNPSLIASLAGIKSAEFVVDTEKSVRGPKINAVASYGIQSFDDAGSSNARNTGRIAIELTYNLFDGGRSTSSLNRAYHDVNQAKSFRDAACANLKQNVQVSLNDIQKIESQIPVLEKHFISSDRVKTAYKDQFEIGQRSLLDVLDSENEFFQASRALVDARHDLAIATAKILAYQGSLLSSLEITDPSTDDTDHESMVTPSGENCPI